MPLFFYLPVKIFKVTIFLISLIPLVLLIDDACQDHLGVNPVEAIHFRLGDWALRFLCIGLSITPVKKIFHQFWVLHFRRMMGLFAFFYASLHLFVYVILDLSLSWQNFIDEAPDSPYIILGLLTYLLLLPLALTSTRGMQRYLGKRWVMLHRLVYLAAITAVAHYLWLVKSDVQEPLVYAVIIGFLLIIRLPFRKFHLVDLVWKNR